MWEQICPETWHHGCCRLHTNLIPWWCKDLQHCRSCPAEGQSIALGCIFSFDMVQLRPSSANLRCSDAELASKAAWWKVPRDAKLNKIFTKVAFLATMLWSSASGRSTSSWTFTGIHHDYACDHLSHICSPDWSFNLCSQTFNQGHWHYMSFSERNNYSENKNNFW